MCVLQVPLGRRLTFYASRILIVLLGVGEVYLVDLRKEHRSRIELCEVQDEEEEEEADAPPRYALHRPTTRCKTNNLKDI